MPIKSDLIEVNIGPQHPSTHGVFRMVAIIDGERIVAYVSSDNAKRWVTVNGRTFVLTKQSGARKSASGQHHTAGELTAGLHPHRRPSTNVTGTQYDLGVPI